MKQVARYIFVIVGVLSAFWVLIGILSILSSLQLQSEDANILFTFAVFDCTGIPVSLFAFMAHRRMVRLIKDETLEKAALASGIDKATYENDPTLKAVTEARLLIDKQQYDKAHKLLISVNNPEADKLLQRLAQIPSIRISNRNGTVVLLIWLFLGLLGGHRFYTGHYRIGIIHLFTLGLVGVGWLIDGFTLLSDNFKDANGNIIKI